MKVKNLKGSATTSPKPTCKCESWIEHWASNKGFKPLYCRSCGSSSNLVGGHVIKVGSYDQKRYIVPICKDCNNKDNLEFDVEEKDLVSANCDNCINK